MLGFLLLVQVSSELFKSFEPYLNPGDIFYPTLTWKATPAYLSSNHAQVVIDLTLHFYTQVEILKGYYAVLTISSDIYLTTSVEQDQPVDEDNQIVFRGVIFPLSQTYGPLRLIIYSSVKGQIIASCVSYGGISVAPPKSDPGKLTIEYEQTASVITSTNTALEFGLTLTEKVYIDDYFELNITDAFKIGSDLDVNIEYNDSDEKFDSSFTDKAVNILNFKKEMLKGKKLLITIKGFLNPDFVRSEPYSWEFAVYRYGTRTIRQRFVGQGPLNGPNYPSISLLSWQPTFKYTDTIVGSVLYMDLIIQMNMTVPDLIAYNVTFSGVNVLNQSFVATNANQSMFPITDYTPVTCVIDPITIFAGCISESTYVTVGTYKLEKDGNFTLRLITEITSEDAQVDEVKVLYNDPLDGDLVISSISYTVEKPLIAIQGTAFENFRVYFTTNALETGNEVNFNGENPKASMIIEFKTKAVYRANSKFELLLPLSTVGPSSDQIYLGEVEYSAYFNEDNQDITVNILKNIITFSIAVEIRENIMVKIILTPKYTLYLPYFSSNLLTTYEAMLRFKDDDVSQSINRIYFQPQKMEFNFEPLCSTAGLPGLPVKINFKFPFEFSGNGQANYLEINIRSTSINFASDLNSGIPTNTLFPSYNLTYPMNITYGSSIYLSTLRVYFEKFNTIEEVFYIPFAEMEVGENYTITATGKHISSEFKTFEIFTSDSIILTGGAKITSNEINGGNKYVDYEGDITDNIDINVNNLVNKVRTVAVSLSANTVAENFEINDAKVTLKLSKNTQYQYQFHFIDSNITKNSNSLSFTNFKVPWYKSESFAHIYIAESDQFNFSAECLAHYYFKYNVVPKELSLNENTCNVEAFGPSSQLIDLAYSLTTPSTIETYFSDYVIFFELNNILEFKEGSFELSFDKYKFSADFSEAQNTITSFTKELTSIPSGTIITLKIYNIVSPAITEDSTDFVFIENFEFKYLGLVTSKLESISCKLIANRKTGKSTLQKLFIFPNQRDVYDIALSTYFQIQATFDIDIPALSNITLVGHEFDPDEKIQANTWCSHIVNGVAFTLQNYLSIVNLKKIPKNELFELRKDISFSVPNDPNIQYTGYFLFNITYKDIIIVLDSDKTEDRRIEYLNNSYVELTITDIYAQKYNRGELVYYTFEFKIKSHETSSDWAFIFDIPGSYDSHFGNSTIKFPEKQPNVYYLNSKSSLANIECTIDHWIVVCTGFEVIQSGTTIDISLEGYTPPRAKSEDFYMYIVNKTDFNTILATATSNLNKPFEAISGDNIDLISISIAEPESYESQYTFQVSLDSSFIIGSAILFAFPIQYNLPRDNPEFVDCNATYNEQVLSISTKCKSEGKFISVSFTKQHQISGIVSFFFEKIMNPFNAWSRKTSSVPDVIYSSYDLWTQKFEIYIILENASVADKYDYKSYMNKNAGYVGFKKRIFEEFLIDNTDSLSIGYSLNGCPGTISIPIKISVRNNRLLAQNITIRPWEYYNKILFDQSSYELTFENPVTYFRMKIPTDLLAFGQYYIAMNISESPLIDKKYRYGIPTKIPVYITLDNNVQINIETSSNMTLNEESLPIKIDLNNQSPASSLIVELIYTGKGLSQTTWTLNFKPGQYFKYFTVLPIREEDSYELTMKISDTDKLSFIKTEAIILYLDKGESKGEDNIEKFDWEVDYLSLKITIKLSNPSIVYWALGSERRYFSNFNDFSFETIQKNSYDPANPSSPSYQILSNQESRFSKYSNKLASLYPNYEQYSLKLIEYGETLKFYGAEVIGNEEKTLGPYELLVPGINYTLILYAFNGTVNSTINFKTDEIESPKFLDISFESDDIIKESDYLNILTDISNFPNNRFRLYTSFKRMMKQYSEKFLVYSSPRYGYNSTVIESDIKNGLSSRPEVKITSDEFERHKDIPYIKKSSIELYKDTYINLTVSLSEPGKICCIIEESPDTTMTLYYYDLYLGYGRNREKAFMSNCSFLTKENMTDYMIAWQFADNYNYTRYLLSCASCNLYPVLPQCNEDYLEYSFDWIEALTSPGVILEFLIWWILV